ncbi:hypothetical protein BJY14_004860 [Actinomadura luteofluorescens]|uniref:Uncharacterized protein n=1 Tax=Actinomadura luteofluorescens TaxID=46163 RepID=A0A7Y9JH21_9ACTN|nr:hypothetical protein [Actinomadura luteofluorescens]NYD48877.1 hypothetical protein [Actinomadura luteofluorescens]
MQFVEAVEAADEPTMRSMSCSTNANRSAGVSWSSTTSSEAGGQPFVLVHRSHHPIVRLTEVNPQTRRM